MAASAVAHQVICWPQVYKHKPKTYCVVCGQYTKPRRAGKKLYKCVEQECKNHIHAECNSGKSSFNCTLSNLALLRKLEGSIKEKITFGPDNTDLENKTFAKKGYIKVSGSERLNFIERDDNDMSFNEIEDIIHHRDMERTTIQENSNDINNNIIYKEPHQHRKEHKRKPHNEAKYVDVFLINDKTADSDISLVKSYESNREERQECKDSDISSVKSYESNREERQECKDSDSIVNQHRKEHKRKALANVENTVDHGIDTGENESIESNNTNHFKMVELISEANNSWDIFNKLANFDQQRNEDISQFSEGEDSEMSEAEYEENYIELMEQIYFKGHITDRNRKKYMRKWRKHRKKRKRICKKAKISPIVTSKIEENEDEQDKDMHLTSYDKENVMTKNTNYNDSDDSDDSEDDDYDREDDIYNELYDEYESSYNKPKEDQSFLNFVRGNNERNLHPYELPEIIYIIDNTDPDEYKPPDYYFE